MGQSVRANLATASGVCVRRTLKILVAAFFLTTLVQAVLWGQDYRGKIQGAVRDPSQAVVVGASVTLRNVNTGAEAVRKTNETGSYLFDLVEPGSYTVTVEMVGFAKFLQENVPLAARGDITVDAVLRTGSLTETVTVTAQASQVQFNTSKLDTTVESRISTGLPQL